MQEWIAHTERDGEPVTGSTRKIKAESAVDAARYVTQAYWKERPTLFDRVDEAVRQVIVVVQPAEGHRRDPREPATRWSCRVTVTSDAEAEGVSVEVEPLP